MKNAIRSAPESHRLQFARAVVYAKQCLLNPAVSGAYAAIVGGRHSVYIAALKDAMHAPKLINLQTDAYTGSAGQQIKVQAIDNFQVVGVEFTLFAGNGRLLECGQAIRCENGFNWVYTTVVRNPAFEGTLVQVSALDLPGNNTKLSGMIQAPFWYPPMKNHLLTTKIQTMKQSEIDQMSLMERAQADTPPFFLKLRNIALALAALSGSVLAAPIALPPLVMTIAGYLGVAAAAIGAVSQVTVKA